MPREMTVTRRLEIGDSHYGEWRDRLKLRTTAQQDRDCLTLEAHGLRFLVDYGYENAHENVLELCRQAKRGQCQ